MCTLRNQLCSIIPELRQGLQLHYCCCRSWLGLRQQDCASADSSSIIVQQNTRMEGQEGAREVGVGQGGMLASQVTKVPKLTNLRQNWFKVGQI